MHETALIGTVAAGLGLAFVFGLIDSRIVPAVNPDVLLIVRTHSDEERAALEASGADVALVGERELAISMTRHALRAYGADVDMADVAARTLQSN